MTDFALKVMDFADSAGSLGKQLCAKGEHAEAAPLLQEALEGYEL